MVEFVVVGPIITLLGLAILQYGLLFFSRNHINHASFMAARAGTMAHARPDEIRESYLRAMVPLYGGGRTSEELAQAKAKADADLAGNLRIDLLNPTRASFDDWNAPWLQQKYGARAIPNAGLGYRDKSVGSRSGQSVQDANLLKLKVTHGYELKVPLIRGIYQHYLQWQDDGRDALHTELIKRGRLPVVSHVTLHMQSDAIEDQSQSQGGHGGADTPANPGAADGADSPAGNSRPPPKCITIGCTVLDPTGRGEPNPDEGASQGGGGNGANPGDTGGKQCF